MKCFWYCFILLRCKGILQPGEMYTVDVTVTYGADQTAYGQLVLDVAEGVSSCQVSLESGDTYTVLDEVKRERERERKRERERERDRQRERERDRERQRETEREREREGGRERQTDRQRERERARERKRERDR